MTNDYKEITKQLENASFYDALTQIRALAHQDGLTTDLLMLLYFTYHLMYLMSKHQNVESERYKRLRRFFLYKLKNEAADTSNVFLNLSVFLNEQFKTFQRFVWFDKKHTELKLVKKALEINPDNNEAQFYQNYFSDNSQKCVELLLNGDFDDSFIRKYLSTVSFSHDSNVAKEKLELLQQKYEPQGTYLDMYIYYHYECNEYEKAYDLFNNNPESKDPSKRSYISFGHICMKLGKFDEALFFYKQAEQTEPNYLALAECYEKTGNKERAIENYKKEHLNFRSGNLTTVPDALIRLEAYDDLQELLEYSQNNRKSFGPELIKMYQAELQYLSHNYKESVRSLEEVEPLFNNHDKQKPEKCYLYQALNNCEMTIEAMKSDYDVILGSQNFNLENISPVSFENLYCYHQFRKHIQKLNLLSKHKYGDKETELEQKIFDSYKDLNQKLYQEAILAEFELKPNITVYYLSFFDGDVELNKKVELYRKRLEEEPKNPSFSLSLGESLLAKGEYENAKKHLLQAANLAKKYFVDLDGRPELTLIKVNNLIENGNTKANTALFVKSMRAYIENSSYEASIRTAFLGSTLYKYKTFSVNTIASLANDYMFFSESKKFNDPFDVNTHLISKLFNDTLEVDNDLYKSFSLAKEPDNSLMWAHYADDHKGICIGYQINYLPSYVGKGEINYKDNLLKENKTFEALNDYWLTKGKDWEYEKEVRLLHFGERTKIDYCFDKHQALEERKISVKINEIVFGLRFSIDHESILMPILKEIEERQNQKIIILRASKDENHPLKLNIASREKTQ